VGDNIATKIDWVQRVLGVAIAAAPPASASEAKSWQAARQAWQDANDAVNDQINALRAAVLDRAKADPENVDVLAAIADKGLNAITRDHRVKLMASILELGGGAPAVLRKSGPRALGLITAFESFIAASEEIEVCDGNPFGVPVSIRATLVPALQGMAAALRAEIGG